MAHRIVTLGALMLAVAAAPAGAQVCMDQNRNVEPNLSQQLQAMVASRDPQAMSAVAGTWMGQVPAPDGSVARTMYRYLPNGDWSYQQQVCSPNGYCGTYTGGGVFAAVRAQNGGITIMSSLTDGNFTNYCSIHSFTFSGDMLRGDDGSTLQRMP